MNKLVATFVLDLRDGKRLIWTDNLPDAEIFHIVELYESIIHCNDYDRLT